MFHTPSCCSRSRPCSALISTSPRTSFNGTHGSVSGRRHRHVTLTAAARWSQLTQKKALRASQAACASRVEGLPDWDGGIGSLKAVECEGAEGTPTACAVQDSVRAFQSAIRS